MCRSAKEANWILFQKKKKIQLEEMNQYAKTFLAYVLCIYYYLKTITGFIILFFTKNHTNNFWHVKRRLGPPNCIKNFNDRYGETKFVEVNVGSRSLLFSVMRLKIKIKTSGDFYVFVCRTWDCITWKKVTPRRSWLCFCMDSQNFGE